MSANDNEYKYVLGLLGDITVPVRRIYLKAGDHVVGTAKGAEIQIPIDGVSRNHARLTVFPDGGVMVEDLGSTNGTFVNRKRVRRVAIGRSALLGFGTVEADLRPLDDGAAIAIASTGREPLAVDKTASDADLTTARMTLDTRLHAELGVHAGALVAGEIGCDEFARRLARDWCATLEADALEITVKHGDREAHVIAQATHGESLDSKGKRFGGPGGLEVCVWSRMPLQHSQIEAIMLVAMELIRRALPAQEGADPGGEREPGAALPGPGSLNPRMLSLHRTCAKVAVGTIPILILGESGCGKEILARWIHDCSGRTGPFLALNCAALPKDLLEAELFGVERGAATGVEARPGILERTNGGTVFLDEVGDMAPETQARLLRALEDTTIFRVGGRTSITIDVRFVAATNQDLRSRVDEGHFRLDLFHRLAAFDVSLPALKDRREDIPLLTGHFFDAARKAAEIRSPGITKAALSRLIAYPWPGNVRELKNEIERATLLLEPGEPLDTAHLSDRLKEATAAGDGPRALTLEEAVLAAERQAFAVALAASGNDTQKAMALLGLPRSSFYRKLKQHGLTANET